MNNGDGTVIGSIASDLFAKRTREENTMIGMSQPLHELNVGEIAAQLPGASRVFRHFGINFCCQGDVPLAEAVQRSNANLIEVESALNTLDPAASARAPQKTDELIDYILTRYHDTHRQQLAELIELSRKVEAVHATHPQVPAGLADSVEKIRLKLEIHMQKEESVLFPAMRKVAAGPLNQPIRQMRRDHDDHGALLDEMRRLTNDFTLPDGACRSWQTLYRSAAQFQEDLMEHIHLENNVLFPRFAT